MECAAIVRQHSHGDFDATASQPPHTPPGNVGVWVNVSHGEAPEAGAEDGVGARAGAPDVAARLEGHRHRGSAKRAVTVEADGALESDDLGVGSSDGPGVATAENAVTAVHHRADARVWMGSSPGFPALGQRESHGGFGGHGSSEAGALIDAKNAV